MCLTTNLILFKKNNQKQEMCGHKIHHYLKKYLGALITLITISIRLSWSFNKRMTKSLTKRDMKDHCTLRCFGLAGRNLTKEKHNDWQWSKTGLYKPSTITYLIKVYDLRSAKENSKADVQPKGPIYFYQYFKFTFAISRKLEFYPLL